MAMILTAAFVSLQLKGAEFIKNRFAEEGIAAKHGRGYIEKLDMGE